MEHLPQQPKSTPKAPFLALAFVSVFFFSGCGLSDLTQTVCDTTGGDPHCSQEAAVQSGEAENCDRVAQKEEFKQVGSNPPRDKCVVMVAANNEDPEKCNNVKGGTMSYTKEDCLKAISDTAHNPSTCSKLGGLDIPTCINNVAEKTFNDIDRLKNMKTKTAQDIKELQEAMAKIQQSNEMLSNINKERINTQQAVIRNLR